MDAQPKALETGLYLVATPIGHARDITLRALDILAAADVLAAEDTRRARRLMQIHGVAPGNRPLIAYHDHNGRQIRPRLLAHLAAGRSVAYMSDAGTPLVADPGYPLVRAARDEGFAVYAAPGASAILTALTVSGMPTDQFHFAGFAPTASDARAVFLTSLREVPGTLVFYESSKRLAKLLSALVTVFGPDRPAAMCRELTKKFEDVRRATLGRLLSQLPDLTLKGECVLLVGGGTQSTPSSDEIDAALCAALLTHSLKDAVKEVSRALEQPRRRIYQRALELVKE